MITFRTLRWVPLNLGWTLVATADVVAEGHTLGCVSTLHCSGRTFTSYGQIHGDPK